MEKCSLIYGIFVSILGLLILPHIAEYIFGDYICGHYNMYFVSFAIILIGIYIAIKGK